MKIRTKAILIVIFAAVACGFLAKAFGFVDLHIVLEALIIVVVAVLISLFGSRILSA